MWQLDESMGTNLVNTTGYPWDSGGTPDGIQTELAINTTQECVNECIQSSSCIGATWIYSNTSSTGLANYSGSCLTYVMSPIPGPVDLYVKMLPMDYLAGSSTGGKAAVSSGHYQFWSDATANLGVSINGTVPTSLSNCKVSCDNEVQCWGFYYGPDCDLRKGLEGEGHRTFIHVKGEMNPVM